MATFYPTIASNASITNGNAKFDFSLNPDNSFDVFKFKETDGVESAYLLFTIKNTATGAGEDLNITSISGNAMFNNHFSLDFIEEGETLLHLGLDGSAQNKLKDLTNISSTNTGVVAAAVAANASGAAAFFGHGNTQISGFGANFDATGFNPASANRITPIYTTSAIIGTDIPPVSYATFLVKYKPNTSFTAQDFADDPMTLTILNSHSAQIINFTGNAVNSLNFNAVIGTSAGGAGSTDTFVGGNDVLTDQGTYHLGYHPVGYEWDSTDKTLKLRDNSATPGDYGFESHNNLDELIAFNFIYNSNTPTLDGYNLAGNESGFFNLKSKLITSFKHGFEDYTAIGNCATQGGADIGNDQTNVNEEITQADTLFKNFEFKTGDAIERINYRASHKDWTVANPEKDYGEVTEALIKLKTHYYLRNIINISSPEDTPVGDRAFIYAVTCGFYNKLGMSADELTNHANSLNSIIGENGHNIVLQLNQSTDGPWLQTKDGGAMFRDRVCNFASYFLYHNFDNNTAEAYKVNTTGIDFAKTEDDSLVLTTSQGGHYHAKYYSNSLNFATGGGAYGTNINTTTDGVTFQGFSSTAANENRLAVKYEIGVKSWIYYNMYSSAECTSFSNDNNTELAYGIYKLEITPDYTDNDTIWKKGLGSHNIPYIKNNLYFLPIQSKLNLLDYSQANPELAPEPYIFYDGSDASYLTDSNGEAYKRSAIVTKVAVGTWYKHSSSNTTSADVKTKTYATDDAILAQEGDWYGSSGMTVNQPKCWKNNASRRYTPASGSGVYIDHAAVNKNIKINSTTFYPETGDVANFYFKMQDASYDSNLQKFRSMGELYVENTGDYLISIQSVSVGHVNLSISGDGSNTNGDLYMNHASSLDNMLMPSTGVSYGEGRKPDLANSSEPTWAVAVKKNNIGSVSWDDFTSGQSPQGLSSVISGVFHSAKARVNEIDETSTTDIMTFYDTPTTKRHSVPTEITGSQSGSQPGRNPIVIGFELTPTNTSSYDQGAYYTQILVSYYVNDYKNRKSAAVDGDGNITETNASMGTNSSDYNTRLHVSKYLLRCDVSPSGVIKVVDTENDEAPSTIDLPNLSIG